LGPAMSSPGGSQLKREYVHTGHDSGGAGETSSRSLKRGAKINGVDAASSSSSATFALSSDVADTLRAEVERLSNENRTLVRQKVAFESLVLAHIQSLTEHAARLRAGNVQLVSLVKCNPNMKEFEHADIPGAPSPVWLTETVARRNAADAAAASGVAAVLDYA